MTRYRTSGQDNWTGQRPPMTDARRQTIHGPLQALIASRPANEPHPLVGGALLIAIFITGTLLLVGFS